MPHRIDPIAARKDQLARWEAHIAAGQPGIRLRDGAIDDLRHEIERMEAARQKRRASRCERLGHDDEPIRPHAVRCMRCGRIA